MTEDTHELRELRFRLKTLAKHNGRQGDTIHRLRAELAESREINGRIARGELRDLERRAFRQSQIIADMDDQLERLREKLQSIAPVIK